jgi:hypothetical protein
MLLIIFMVPKGPAALCLLLLLWSVPGAMPALLPVLLGCGCCRSVWQLLGLIGGSSLVMGGLSPQG